MVFSSIPAYLDPSNWQQQPNNQTGGSNQGSTAHQFAPPPPQPTPPPQPHGAGGAGSIRPGSMADRARLANIPMPEPALKCPRCESTNTKFCYFNNYSLSQPRHFCKTCRRYWTRGGALRNVPVGGGCRRNKRSKGSSSGNSASKSPASSDRQAASGSTSTMSSGTSCDILGFGPQIPPLRFMAPLHHLTSPDFAASDIGLNYGSNISALGAGNDLNFHIGSTFANAAASGGGLGGATGASSLFSSFGGLDQWRMQQAQQQMPFLGGLDSSSSSSGLYGFDHGGVLEGSAMYGGSSGQIRGKMPSSGLLSQFASVKMEDSNNNRQQEMNFPRQFLGMQGNDNNDQYNWTVNPSTAAATASAWTDLSSFNSSSNTSNPL